jgi:hypothetical protein
MYLVFVITIKLADAVIYIKQSPVLKGHPFPILSYNISYELNLSYKATFSFVLKVIS